jgi:3-deoxy-D-manno-octulosonic-acid transferase
MSPAFFLYPLAAGLALLLAAPYLALFRPQEFRERLGGGEAPGKRQGIWIHAASLGEFEAAWPVIREARWAAAPMRIVVSCTNAAARRRLKDRLPAGARGRLAPLDFWPCVSGALHRERPLALVFFETEIWPAWILAAERAR